jgi:hypothetical protein
MLSNFQRPTNFITKLQVFRNVTLRLITDNLNDVAAFHRVLSEILSKKCSTFPTSRFSDFIDRISLKVSFNRAVSFEFTYLRGFLN